ncbi:hypothetical protein [Streptomonospora arabica]|uniref:Uncharacterized protein n=1 Tax=Streptomonospora arabica TaxID=412417 RepID=A0ABV9SSJ3_9ACTN
MNQQEPRTLAQVEEYAASAWRRIHEFEKDLRRYIREDKLQRHLDDIRKRGDDFARMHNSLANKVAKLESRLRKVEEVATSGQESAVLAGVVSEIAAAHGREAVEADTEAARRVLALLRGEKS